MSASSSSSCVDGCLVCCSAMAVVWTACRETSRREGRGECGEAALGHRRSEAIADLAGLDCPLRTSSQPSICNATPAHHTPYTASTTTPHYRPADVFPGTTAVLSACHLSTGQPRVLCIAARRSSPRHCSVHLSAAARPRAVEMSENGTHPSVNLQASPMSHKRQPHDTHTLPSSPSTQRPLALPPPLRPTHPPHTSPLPDSQPSSSA